MNSFDFSNNKIVSREALVQELSIIRSGKVVVSTNGCFDILHPGHIKFLENAKSLGDILVVALNSDSSVSAIKGKTRPIIKQELRAYALASLLYPDYVTIFEERTPELLLEQIKPDIHVKGEEYKESGIPERDAVTKWGGKVVYLPIVKGLSTSIIINKLGN